MKLQCIDTFWWFVAGAFSLSITFLVGTTTCTASDRPNVILILADDLAIGDLASRNGGLSRTPNLDKLASESVRFEQAYSASCVCAPARAALLTGRYPHRTGVVTLNMNKFPKLTRLHSDEITIATLMKEAGYATGLIGKWHLGRGKPFHPLSRGFDEFEGFDGSQVLSYFNYALDVHGEIHKVENKYLTDELSERAIQFVRRHRSRPFFLHLAHYAPHRPLEAPAAAIDFYRKQGLDESTATIYAMIEVMDRGIGQLLDELDSLEIAKKTIVIFASDNGPDPLTGTRFNQDLRGTKYQVYEGGIRVPLFFRWTEEFEPGARHQLVQFVDLLPTILQLCQIQPKLQFPVDGKSFADVLIDAATEFAPVRFWQWNRGEPNYTHNAAVREGDYKLVRPFITRGIRLKDSTARPMLFDLSADPAESQNIADEHPNLVLRLRTYPKTNCS